MKEIYAGILLGKNGEPDQKIFVLSDEPATALTWEVAMAWAKSLDASLPTKRELALLYANVPELFENECYWSSEQSASFDGIAWSKPFGYGGQYYDGNDSELRARAVRRVPV